MKLRVQTRKGWRFVLSRQDNKVNGVVHTTINFDEAPAYKYAEDELMWYRIHFPQHKFELTNEARRALEA